MSATSKIRQYAKDALRWLECVELAESQGDVPAAEMARERAGFASNKAFAVVQQASA